MIPVVAEALDGTRSSDDSMKDNEMNKVMEARDSGNRRYSLDLELKRLKVRDLVLWLWLELVLYLKLLWCLELLLRLDLLWKYSLNLLHDVFKKSCKWLYPPPLFDIYLLCCDVTFLVITPLFTLLVHSFFFNTIIIQQCVVFCVLFYDGIVVMSIAWIT